MTWPARGAVRLVAAVAALFCVLVLTVAAPPQARAASALSPLGRSALARLSQCLQSSGDLAALLLIDESQSLVDTDPRNVRAQVLPALVDQLGDIANLRSTAGKRRVDLAVSTFAAGYTEWLPWQQLTPASTPTIASTLREELPNKNHGQLTNYVAALKGARSTMAAGTARFTGSQAPCKLMVWFTDGVLDVGTSTEDAAARDVLCSTSGPVAALRDDDVITAAVLLLDRTRLDRQQLAEIDKGRADLQAAAESRGGPQGRTTCGGASVGAAPGVYLEGDVNALAGLFARIIQSGKGGIDRSPGHVGTPVTLRVDPGVASFSVVADAPQGLTLTPPSGTALSLPSGAGGTRPVGDSTAAVRWVGETATVDVPVTARGTGRWLLRRTGSSEPIGFYLFADLDVTLNGSDLVAGEVSTLHGAVRRGDGSPFDARVFKTARLTVEQTGSGNGGAVPVQLSNDGTFTARFTPAKNSTAVRFVVTFTAQTTGGDRFLVSRVSVQPVTALGYPLITPTELRLGSVQRTGDTARATVVAKGPSQGPATVCILGLHAAGNSSLTGLRVRPSAQTCHSLRPGQQVSIPISLQLEKATAQGREARGVVEISRTRATSTRVDSTAALTSTVPFSVQVLAVRTSDWLFAGILVGGFLLPLLLMYGVQALAKRLLLTGVMCARVPVELMLPPSAATLRRRDIGAPVLRHTDLTYLPQSNRRASFDMTTGPTSADVSWGEQLRARQSVNPFASPYGEVQAPSGKLVLSVRTPGGTRRGGTRARIPLSPDNEVYLLVDRATLAGTPDDRAVPATLVALIRPDGDLATAAASAGERALSSADAWAAGLRAAKESLVTTPAYPAPVSAAAGGTATGGPDWEAWGLPSQSTASRGTSDPTGWTPEAENDQAGSSPGSGSSFQDWGLDGPAPGSPGADSRPRRRIWRRAEPSSRSRQRPPGSDSDW